MLEPAACVLSEVSQATLFLLELHLPFPESSNRKPEAYLQLVRRL